MKNDTNWYFVTKIVLTYCEKKNSSDREKLEITRTIYLKSERSDQFFKQNVIGI